MVLVSSKAHRINKSNKYAINTRNTPRIDKASPKPRMGWPLSGWQTSIHGQRRDEITDSGNPHGGVLSVGMVSEILKETGISRVEWLSAN